MFDPTKLRNRSAEEVLPLIMPESFLLDGYAPGRCFAAVPTTLAEVQDGDEVIFLCDSVWRMRVCYKESEDVTRLETFNRSFPPIYLSKFEFEPRLRAVD